MKAKQYNKITQLDCLKYLAQPVYSWQRWLLGLNTPKAKTCSYLRQRLRKALSTFRRSEVLPQQTEACLDDYAISNYLHGTAEPNTIKTMDQHLTYCDWCLVRTWAVLNKNIRLYHKLTFGGEWRETPFWSKEIPPISKFLKGVLGFIIVLLLFFLLIFIQKYKSQQNLTKNGYPVLRESPPASLEIPASIWKKHDEFIHFQWNPVPQAQYYRIIIWNAEDGHVVFEENNRESRISVPVKVYFTPGVSYLWKVEAIAFQRVLKSYPAMSFNLDEE